MPGGGAWRGLLSERGVAGAWSRERRSTGVRASREYTARVNRRTFLAATHLIPLDCRSWRPLAGALSTARVPSTFDPWVEIHAANLGRTPARSRRLTKRPVLAVIKNNGYGLGVVSSAKVLEAAGVGPWLRRGETAGGARPSRAGHQEAGAADGAGRRARSARSRSSRDIMPMVYTPIGDLLERESRRARAAPFRFTSASTPASAASACRTGRPPR